MAEPLAGTTTMDHVTASDLGEPTVIVDDLNVVYRVRGAGQGRKKKAPGAAARGGVAGVLGRLVLGHKDPAITEIHAVKGVSFVARRGDAIGLIGHNGSGKSTLLRAIAGLLPAESGAVYSAGQPSLLGVHAVLMNDLTGDANVRLGGLAMGLTPDEVAERYDEVADFAGLGRAMSLPMRTYSSGMSARLRFAIASVKTHEVLLIDEALATGDKAFRKRSENRINEMRQKAGTVFLVSHSLGPVRNTCNRVIWLDGGRIKMDGPTAEVLEAYQASA